MVPQIHEEAQSLAPISSIKFSCDGKLMIAVMEGRIYLLDAFNGAVLYKFLNGMSYAGPALEATLSPDSKYLLSGARTNHHRSDFFYYCGHTCSGILTTVCKEPVPWQQSVLLSMEGGLFAG